MKKNGLAVFKMEKGDFKITLKTAEAGIVVQHSPVAAVPVAAAPQIAAPAGAAPEAAAAPGGPEIKSPMVGTFYSSPSPDAEPFVKVGQEVTPDTVVCIIEAMKVMNEIKAETKGTIVEIVADNGKPVQYGAALFRVEPS